jgi:hypothetical protein
MNDMILNMLANDSFTVSDFRAAGLSAENTKLESEERYKQSEMIRNNPAFQVEGEFNDELFHQYYLYATDTYGKLADETYIEDITKNTFYSQDNIFAPNQSQVINETPQFVINANPFLQNNSLTRVGKRGDRTLSVSEIAQTQKVYDSKMQEFRDESVNDRALGNNPFKWLGDLFSEPLVIAQWDEDGEHVDLLTGETRKHKKGDYKYNDEGTFYYETLGGRDVYGRQVLNRMNTLTVDGSTANKYDFFDSDDLEQKGFIGTTLKNLALVGSMFLPVVGKPIIAASIATQSIGLLGALGKMFLGSENETVNNMHAWAKTVNRQSTSEYASQNTWCWENMLNMIGDTVGQLAEQRFLFTHVPALFKGMKGVKAQKPKTYQELLNTEARKIQNKTSKEFFKARNAIKADSYEAAKLAEQEYLLQWKTKSELAAQAALESYMESYRHLGSVMSKAYMTGITIQDTYGEAKANGASDLEAIALTLGYAAGEAWILNTGLGEWIMPELHGDKLKYKAMVNALKKEVKDISGNAAEAATKEGRQNIFKKIFNLGKKFATDDYAKQQFVSSDYNPMKVVLAHAMGEGFEEVSEELLADVSKSTFNVVNWLRGDETRIAGTWENVLDRYGMSLIGGFLGGGISSVNTDFSQARELGKMTTQSAIQEIIYMVNNDKIDDFLKFVNKADLGNKYLSTETDEQGNYKPGTKEHNQDSEIKKILNMQVKLIRDVINAEGAKYSENSLFDALTLKDLRYLQLRDTATAGLFFQEYNSLISDIYDKHERIRTLSGDYTDTDSEKKQLSEAEAGEITKLKKELEELRVRKDALLSGKRAPEFIQTALYEASLALQLHNRGFVFHKWAEKQTGKKFEDLTTADIENLTPKYKAYRDTEMKNDILKDSRRFIEMVGLASKALQEQNDYLDQLLASGRDEARVLQNTLETFFNIANTKVSDPDFDLDAFVQETTNDLSALEQSTVSILFKKTFGNAIRDKLIDIDAKPITDIYTETIKNMEKVSVVYETLAEYSDTLLKSFIDKGHIHPEVKNHLITVLNQAIVKLNGLLSIESKIAERDSDWGALQQLPAYEGKTQDEIAAIWLDTDSRVAAFTNNINNLKDKIAQLQELPSTPIIDLLENVKLSVSDSETSVKDVLNTVNNLLNQSHDDISAFTAGPELARKLEEVDEIIDLVSSAIYATRVDKIGVNNAWGYSKTLNELNKKYGNDQWVQLAELEGDKANLVQQDLAVIKQKVQYAINLNKINSGQKLNQQNRVGYNRSYIFFNKFKRLVNIIPERLPEWNIQSLVEVLPKLTLLGDTAYNGEVNNKRMFTLTDSEKIQLERETLMMDDAIYQFFQDNLDKVNDAEKLAELINADNFNLFSPEESLLTDQVDDLDDGQFVFSLAARAALKSRDFFNVLRTTYHEGKAPIPMQEQATYLNVAMAMNGDVVNQFAKAYAIGVLRSFKDWDVDKRKDMLLKVYSDMNVVNYYADNPDKLSLDQLVDTFSNIVLTEGIAGSGKSGGVFDSGVHVLRKLNEDMLKNVFFVNATHENATESMRTLGLEGKAFSSSEDEPEHDILSYFYEDYDNKSSDPYKNKVKIVNGKFTTLFKLRKDLSNVPKLILIDETSRLDYVKMKLIEEAAQHYGIAVWAAGDFDQISAQNDIIIDGQTYTLEPHRLNFIHSAKLGLSFRTLNDQMVLNQSEVQTKLYTADNSVFTIGYWEDDKEIRGFKTHSSSEFDAIVESINKIKKNLAEGETIGFLYSDESESLYGKLKEKFGDLIVGKSIYSAQGLEGNYYIIDFNRKTRTSNVKALNREFYTAFTRAKIGGIIINDKSGITINNIRNESSELQSITPQDIARSSEKRKAIFDTIYQDEDEVNIPYKPLTPIEKETVITPSETTVDEETIDPPLLSNGSIVTPPGMYNTREEAEKVDLSAYAPSLELINKDGNVEGEIIETRVEEFKDKAGNVFYTPAVIIKSLDGSTQALYYDILSQYTLRNPASQTLIHKYKVGDVFYNSEGISVEILEAIPGSPLQYKIKHQDGSISVILESDLNSYSTIPPITYNEDDLDGGEDLGENDDSDTYRNKRNGANDDKLTQRVESDGRIHHWMYTFNAYETGVLWNPDGTIRPEHFDPNHPIGMRTKARIDNVNGLLDIAPTVITRTSKKQECLAVLAKIHSQLMYNTSNEDLKKEVANILQIDQDVIGSIEYGIKSSPGISSKSSNEYGLKDEDANWHVFDKHRDEKSEYAQPNVIAGDAISKKDVVAVFRDNRGKKILEITVGVLNSPLTIGQMTDGNNNYIYPEIGALLERLSPNDNSSKVFPICEEAIKICQAKGYTDLGNLFKAFLFTSSGFVSITNADGTAFNLASQFNYGPNVIKQKGDYQKDGTRRYEANYTDLSEFASKEPTVVSAIYIPTSNMYGGVHYPYLHPGHAGVFVSYNLSHDKDSLADLYLKQQHPSYKGVKDVKFVYIIPPEATVEEYLRNFRHAYLNKVNGETHTVYPIGNMWTSYKLLRNVYKAGDFPKLRSMMLNQVEMDEVTAVLDELIQIEERTDWASDEEYKSQLTTYKKIYKDENTAKKYAIRGTILQKQKDILMSQTRFKDISMPVYKVLTNYVANAGYQSKLDTTPNTEAISILNKHNKATIRYKVKYSTEKAIGPFVKAETSGENAFTLKAITSDGAMVLKAFQINGKVDPPIFEFNGLTNNPLTTAIGILADWKYANPADTNSRKDRGVVFNQHTYAYRSDSIARPTTNNFEKLKSNNKILFEATGLFHGIQVRGENDPQITQVDLATQILEQFNAVPNNIGFGIVSADGDVELHAYQINKLPGDIALPENQTPQSLGGITIGKALIFQSGDTVEVQSALRNYKLSINGSVLEFEYFPAEGPKKFIPITLSNGSGITIVEAVKAVSDISNSISSFSPSLQGMFKPIPGMINTSNVTPITDALKRRAKSVLDKMVAVTSDENLVNALNTVINYIDSTTSDLNVAIGDTVAFNSTEGSDTYSVSAINGTQVTLDDNTVVDVNQHSLYKVEEDNTINCPKNIIKIKYGN